MAAKSKKLPQAAEESAAVEAGNAASPTFPGLNLDDLTAIGRENMEAVTKANLALSEGLAAIGSELLGYARTSLESASQTASALLGAKTFDEVLQLQSEAARSGLELLLKRSAKLSELGVTLASEALAPFGGRVEAAFAKLAG